MNREFGDGAFFPYHFGDASKKGKYLKDFKLNKGIIYKFY